MSPTYPSLNVRRNVLCAWDVHFYTNYTFIPVEFWNIIILYLYLFHLPPAGNA